MRKVEATPGLERTWETMQALCAPTGSPGISHWSKTARAGDATLHGYVFEYRDQQGTLRGALQLHIIQTGRDTSTPTVHSLVVDPSFKRQGIATQLAREALKRWPDLDLFTQQYTEDGAAFVNRFLEKEWKAE
jgi:ribosomal protein S18 acetylase RimI-like enzyme